MFTAYHDMTKPRHGVLEHAKAGFVFSYETRDGAAGSIGTAASSLNET
jgi:hypothetical protein